MINKFLADHQSVVIPSAAYQAFTNVLPLGECINTNVQLAGKRGCMLYIVRTTVRIRVYLHDTICSTQFLPLHEVECL